ncbi:chemotaxis protein CheD [Seleniivibrio sp.]|uniref:chemotaxis protein CheD n=1 Tax=Seleniivibrio sp. TaxID=2898801 RepID=UPI0025E4B758|nr:chemotaxis protein CheD [Seleniivibrio sp.]MCD8552670.1 chemotaxis protein CheD [Seleniivibrio sp.]
MLYSIGCVYLKPGEIYFSDVPAVVNTVLGSCVSVTMYVPRLRAGIISHCVLPTALGNIRRNEEAMKYVDCALLYMHKKMTLAGADKRETEVKMFGGSTMFGIENGENSIGSKNISAAVSLIRGLGYCIVKSDTGGSFTRNLSFNIASGVVNIKRTTNLSDDSYNGSIDCRGLAVFP